MLVKLQDRIAKQSMVDQIRNSGASEEELEIPDSFMEDDVNLFDRWVNPRILVCNRGRSRL